MACRQCSLLLRGFIMFEENIPVPQFVREKYPFAKLQPGQSVLFECAAEKRRGVGKAAYRVANYRKWKIIVRTMPEGVRVWRIS